MRAEKQEIEFKWNAESVADFDIFFDSFKKISKRITAPLDVVQNDSYIDTPNFEFLNKKVALRIREVNQKFYLDFKYGNFIKDGFVKRTEGRIKLNSENLKDCLLEIENMNDVLNIKPKNLKIIFEVKNNRTIREFFIDDNNCFEASFDDFTVTSPNHKSISKKEIELEIKYGEEEYFKNLTKKITEECDLIPSSISKFKTGLVLIGKEI